MIVAATYTSACNLCHPIKTSTPTPAPASPSLPLTWTASHHARAHTYTRTHAHACTHTRTERERGEHFSRHGPLTLMLSCNMHRHSRRNTTDEEQEYVLTSSPHHHSGIPLLVCIAMSSSLLSPRLQHRHNNTLIVQDNCIASTHFEQKDDVHFG